MGKTIQFGSVGVIIGLLGLVGIFAVFGSFYTVGAGERGVLTTWGQVSGISGPGLNFKTPFIQGVSLISIRNRPLAWEKAQNNAAESYSKDRQPATIQFRVTWHPLSSTSAITTIYTRYRDIEGMEQAIVIPNSLTGLKNMFGHYDAVEAIQKRDQLQADVETEIRRLMPADLIAIDNVAIEDISFSKTYEDAVEAAMKTQVEVQQKEAQKQKEQIDADIKVIQATADAKVTQLNGDAQAEVIRARGGALHDNPQLVALTAAEKWNGVLPTTMLPGGSVPFLQLPKGE